MGSMSIGHWLIVLGIVLLIFGSKRLPNVGTDLGEVVHGFRGEAKETAPPQPERLRTP